MASEASHQGRAYSSAEAERLLLAALEELMLPGVAFQAVSVDQLRAHAGMARSTFYRYFTDKSGLLIALSASVLKQLYACQRTWLARGAEVSRADIRAGMRETLAVFLEHEQLMRAVAEGSVYDTRIRDAYVSAVNDYARSIERFIRQGQQGGWVVREINAAGTAAALAWMTERTVTQVGAGPSARRVRTVADSLATVVSSTLFPAHP